MENTTLENNKMLADFLGRKGNLVKTLWAFKGIEKDGQVWFNETELRFNVDWNWLILLVDKISENDFVDEFEIKKCSIYGNIVKIMPSKKNTFDGFYFDSSKENLMEVVYNSCVEFVKWYNTQK
jgi:hypothetical protein